MPVALKLYLLYSQGAEKNIRADQAARFVLSATGIARIIYPQAARRAYRKAACANQLLQ
jgi:hypothetical protein